MPTNQLIGAHTSIAGGFDKAVERAEEIGCTAMQIFTKSNKSYFAKKIDEESVIAFKERLKDSQVKYVMAHSAYLINIGSKNYDTRERSVKSLAHELERIQVIGIPHLVIHPGSHLGAGEEECIEKFADGLDKVFKKVSGDGMILLETAAGQGTNVGYTFKQIRQIYDACHYKKRLGVCLDTCHIFAAGYDIATEKGYESMWKEFKRVVGISRLKAIHLNDSKMACGSKKDRHASLGTGEIPMRTFGHIMRDKSLTKIPKILETPDPDKYADEIQSLKRMAS